MLELPDNGLICEKPYTGLRSNCLSTVLLVRRQWGCRQDPPETVRQARAVFQYFAAQHLIVISGQPRRNDAHPETPESGDQQNSITNPLSNAGWSTVA
jgi:hypothetical protein